MQLQNYNVRFFLPTEVEVLFVVAEKWEHHSGTDMVNAVHGKPPWLETAPNAVIDYRLALKRSEQDKELPEVEQMDEQMSEKDKDARDKGLLLVARLEQLAKTDPGFQNWLKVGFDQIESGQWIVFDEDGWKEE